MKRGTALVALVAAAAIPAPAYYHFIHYLSTGNAPEKFDLTALPNKTVTFFVSENGPSTYSATDTFNSVLSQVRQATLVWNSVASSDLRVSFGGLENAATLQNTPGGDVVFEDLPPGLLGYGGPTAKADPATPAGGSPFVPIVRSAVHLNRNLTVAPGPSYNESFFMTVVHEMGHALGLQHTFTSATMSQATTRATTLSHPLDSDDVAGISVLYPNAGFAQFGSITGRITAGGRGVHLASVVAIRTGSGAVSGVTNPDGTYRIDGIPPGQYFVYVHTMPPDANIYGPWNADGTVPAGTGPTDSLFYPGTTAVTAATPVAVQAGLTTTGINIATVPRSAVPIYDGGIYAYFNNNTIAIKPAPVNMFAGPATVVASAVGLGSGGQAPGLGVHFIGGSLGILSGGIRPYQANGYTYVALDIAANLGAQAGPQHLVFNTPDYMYVLPSAINLTQKGPPGVTTIAPYGGGTLAVTGTNWAPDTVIYLDSLPASTVAIDWKAGAAVILPPPGASGQQATVTAYNSDGQNSQFLQSAAPVTYSYGILAQPAIASISPASLPAGAEASVDITGTGFAFTPGLTTVGFGSTDVVVRRVFVLSPNHLQADVSISPNAVLGIPDVSVVTGFQVGTAPAGFQITALTAGFPTPVPVLVNAAPGLTGAYPGAIVSLFGSNLAASGSTAAITIGGQPATILYSSPSQINLQIPSVLTPGPALLVLNNGLLSAFPLTVNIDPVPPPIVAVQNVGGNFIDAAHPAHQGELVIVSLANFAPSGSTVALGRVKISLSGASHAPIQVVQAGSVWQVSLLLSATEPLGQSQPLIVYLDGQSSLPAAIPVADPSGSFTPPQASGS
jgi:uncharacterized protein (TIGR03437 family)